MLAPHPKRKARKAAKVRPLVEADKRERVDQVPFDGLPHMTLGAWAFQDLQELEVPHCCVEVRWNEPGKHPSSFAEIVCFGSLEACEQFARDSNHEHRADLGPDQRLVYVISAELRFGDFVIKPMHTPHDWHTPGFGHEGALELYHLQRNPDAGACEVPKHRYGEEVEEIITRRLAERQFEAIDAMKE